MGRAQVDPIILVFLRIMRALATLFIHTSLQCHPLQALLLLYSRLATDRLAFFTLRWIRHVRGDDFVLRPKITLPASSPAASHERQMPLAIPR